MLHKHSRRLCPLKERTNPKKKPGKRPLDSQASFRDAPPKVRAETKTRQIGQIEGDYG
jgi:hypothetical protein